MLIKTTVESIMQEGKIIENTRKIIQKVKETDNIEVGRKLVASVMKNDLQLSFIKAKKLNHQANSDRALVLRQHYGMKML